MASNTINKSTSSSSLGEILEKILDQGVVIAGDISIAIADVELLTIRIRLIVSSIDKAESMGLDWWKNDPSFCSSAKKQEDEKTTKELLKQNQELLKRLENIESKL